MPYHAVVVSKSKFLMGIQVLISCLWLCLILVYFIDIPEGENGFVIVGMLFFIPFACLLSQVVMFCIFWMLKQTINYFRGLRGGST